MDYTKNNIVKPKILIVGGGIGGLSCATALAETGKFDVTIFESEIFGGQASTQTSKLCNTEISWRVFLPHYHNLNKIITDINSNDNFYKMDINNDVCVKNKQNGVGDKMILNEKFSTIQKVSNFLLIHRDRAINDYHDIISGPYFNSHTMNVIIGPYLGLEPQKVTLSGAFKFIYGIYSHDLHVGTRFTKYPTSDSLINPWVKYLKTLHVKMFDRHSVDKIITDNDGKITSISVNNTVYKGDNIVFSLSLNPLVKLFEENYYLRNMDIYNRLNFLQSGDQYYISVNFYWKKPIITSRKCHIYTFHDGWMPIIIKRFINTDYVEKNCNTNIKEVWNIAPCDYFKGIYIKKYTSQSSFEEIVYEIKMNLINSEHFKTYFDFDNYSWDDYFYGYEFDKRYYKKSPTTKKFSINKGIEKNLIKTNEDETGDNVFYSAYYVKNTVGGASMETSCEIGLNAADAICKKYGITNPRKPHHITQPYIYSIFIPFVLLDKILYSFGIPPITDYVNSLFLICVYLILVIILLIYAIKNIKNNIFN